MILLIDHFDSFTYNVYQAVAELGAEVKVVRYGSVTVEEVRAMKPEAVILSPGPGHPEEVPESVRLVRELYKELPILGICLGHQLIGAAFEAPVVRAPVIMHGKVSDVIHDGIDLFKEMPNPLPIMRYHSLIVEKEELPEELVVQAVTADDSTVMGIRHRNYPLFGVQFHPESIGTPDGSTLFANFLEAVAQHRKVTAS